MAKGLNIRQLNNLYVGNQLAAEIPAAIESRRAFVTITPYHASDPMPARTLEERRSLKPFSKFLNTDHSDIWYVVSVFEIEKDELDIYLREAAISYSAELDIHQLSVVYGLSTQEELEAEVGKSLEDLSLLDVAWRVIPF